MTPWEHSHLSVRSFGGVPEDYIKIHEFLDETKGHFADWRHRAILHNSFGMLLCERIFGPYIVNDDSVEISVREIARRHICEDCNGRVPTVKDWLTAISNGKMLDWMNNPVKSDLEWLRKNLYKQN